VGTALHRERNPDCRKEESRKYRAEHPDRRKETSDRYYQNHREDILQRQARAYKEHPERFREASDKWTGKNRDKVNAASMRRRKTEPERYKAIEKQSRERNRDKVIERTRDWRKRNADHVKKYSKKYDSTHRDPVAAAARTAQWVKDNPEKALANCHKRRARVMGAEGTYAPADIMVLLEHQGCRCVGKNCTRDISQRFTIDHKMPLCRGGSNWPDNLQLLCKSCNCRKGQRTMDEWLAS